MNLHTGGPSSASQGLGALGTIDRHIPAWRCQLIITTISAFLLQKCFPFASAVITETIAGSLPGVWTSRFPQTDMPLMLFPALPSSEFPALVHGVSPAGWGLRVSDLTTLNFSPWLTRGQAWVLCCSVNLTFWVCVMWAAAVSVVPSLPVFAHETLAFLQFLHLCFPCCPQCDVFQESLLWANLCIHDSCNATQSQSDFVNLSKIRHKCLNEIWKQMCFKVNVWKKAQSGLSTSPKHFKKYLSASGE